MLKGRSHEFEIRLNGSFQVYQLIHSSTRFQDGLGEIDIESSCGAGDGNQIQREEDWQDLLYSSKLSCY